MQTFEGEGAGLPAGETLAKFCEEHTTQEMVFNDRWGFIIDARVSSDGDYSKRLHTAVVMKARKVLNGYYRVGQVEYTQ